MTWASIKNATFITMPQTTSFVNRKRDFPGRQSPLNNDIKHQIKRRNTSAVVTQNEINNKIVDSFQPSQFTPFLSSNPHFQTVFGHYFPSPPDVQYNRVTIPTEDNLSTLHIDIANGTSLGPESQSNLQKPVAVVLHGLESNSQGSVTKRIVSPLTDMGFKVCVLNFRSCADPDEVPSTLKLYHAGFTEDVETILREIRKQSKHQSSPPPSIFLCGFSLGANMICQFLGKYGQQALDSFGVVAAAAACVPFDPIACQKTLDGGLKGAIYSSRLVSTMKKKFRAAKSAGVDLRGVDPLLLEKANRVGLIDDYFISPVFGFKDKTDYYRKVRKPNDYQ